MTIIAEPEQSATRRNIHKAAVRALDALLDATPAEAEVRHWSISHEGRIRGYLGAGIKEETRVACLRAWAALLGSHGWTVERYEDDPDWGQIAVSGDWCGRTVEISTGTMCLIGLDVPELAAAEELAGVEA